MPLHQPVLVCFATREEAAPFRELAPLLGDVHVLITGMGRTNATRALRGALGARRAALVVSAGFAGGLDPQLARGTVIGETDDAALQPHLAGARVRLVRFTCADRIAITAGEKRALRSATGAEAVEMESEAIRRVCAEEKIPCAVLRIISDAADDDLPLDFNALAGPDLGMDYGKLFATLVRSPGRLRRLMRFASQLRPVGRDLATTLATFLHHWRGPVGMP
ncbi:MAG: hypothetical protein HY301_09355 [Verrucomicrobia bacterium]|nr:hypothetical protein [Verrucomicrobiota bacterium]